ncbi:hypothetical protein B0H16DRAFT_430370 [Mycena metata]|uniref:Uncharacterized protein n=1 Tax=Mycena metata TaxID=1033252 RepID=A0AAD7JHC9_9AGAR|nr:hypothetical protein B0H16DRAFT_430370 [Mycena metata]
MGCAPTRSQASFETGSRCRRTDCQGFSDLICHKLQSVRDYKEAIYQLEKQSTFVVENIIDSLGDEVSPQNQRVLHEILLILEEVAFALDDADAVVAGTSRRKRSKLRLWLTATQELDSVRDLSHRLRDTVSVLGVATALELNQPSNHFRDKLLANEAEDKSEPAVPSSQLRKLAELSVVSLFFVYRAGVSRGPYGTTLNTLKSVSSHPRF